MIEIPNRGDLPIRPDGPYHADGPFPGTGPMPKPVPPPHHHHHSPPPPPKHGDPFMESMEIQNVAQLRSYIKGQLGAPVICIEITDQQLNFIIADTIKYFQKYYYKVGNYRDYLVLDLIPGCTHYRICDELNSVLDLKTTDWMGCINDLFTLPHNVLYDSVMGMNNSMIYRGGVAGASAGFGDVLGSWNATLAWLEEAKMNFAKTYTVRWNEKDHELSVWPSPERPEKALLEVYKKQKSYRLFNEILFREMVVAKAGMIWTNALRKYTLSISGGGTLNADSLYSSYETMYKDVKDQIRLESPNSEFWIA